MDVGERIHKKQPLCRCYSSRDSGALERLAPTKEARGDCQVNDEQQRSSKGLGDLSAGLKLRGDEYDVMKYIMHLGSDLSGEPGRNRVNRKQCDSGKGKGSRERDAI